MPQSYVSPRFSANDINGRPLVGGRLYTYINGTTTPQATYQDAAGGAANTNPVILNALGEAVVFLTEGVTYTFELRDADDVLMWTQNDILGTGEALGLPVYPTAPTSDVGSPIYITGMGWSNWDGSQYVSDYSTGFGGGQYSHKNKLINGGFMHWFSGASIGPIIAASGAPYTAEQWQAFIGGTASVTVTRQSASSDYGQGRVGPYTARITSNAAATPAGADRNRFRQPIEGFNALALALGSLWGGFMTLSFFVKGSIAGTYSVAFLNDGSPGYRSYVANYTITVAGAWERKVIKVPIDQGGIANWNRDSGTGLQVVFDLGSGTNYEGAVNTWSGTETTRTTGSVRLVSTNAATWEISNVQLESGSQATPFEYLPEATARSLCEEYYFILSETSTGLMPTANATTRQLSRTFPTTMRASPTITLNSPTSTPSAIVPNRNGVRIVWTPGDTTTVASIDGLTANARLP
jgi:hypothetical protein